MCDILTHLINISITNGIFPDELKIGNIIPIYKAGNEEIVGIYRPVSLLSIFSKMYEKSFTYDFWISSKIKIYYTSHNLVLEKTTVHTWP
jgi:hypothetical protein